MKTYQFKELFQFLPKSKIKAGEGMEKGTYPLFTSSPKLTKYYDKYIYEGESLIFGTGGLPSIHYISEKFSTSTDCLIVQKKREYKSKVDTEYVYYFFKSNSRILEDGFHGAGLKHISKKYISNIKIPLPKNVDDQIKITQLLSQVESLIAKREESIELLDELLKSTFLDMFGDPILNPKGWSVYKLSDIALSQLGKMLSKKSKQNINPKPYLRNANVKWGYFDLDEIYEMDFNDNEMKKFSLMNGDLLVCEGGEVGRCAIWHKQLKECYFQKALHRIRVNKEILTSEYLQSYFYWMANLGGLLSSTSETTFSHLTGEKLKKLKVPLPPKSLQDKFATIVQQVEQTKQQHQKSLKELKNLFGSPSQRAFRGELDL